MLPTLLLALAQASERPALPDAAALSARLAALEAAHPDLVRRRTYGRSAAGVELELVTLARGDDAGSRPGLLVIAGLDPEHPFEPWLAAELAERTAAAADGAADALLDAWTVHVLPLADPDGLARARHGGHPGHGPDRDDDRDGRAGEDPPADVDGDGWITHLRRIDPEGELVADPHDPRAVLERADLAERVADEPGLGVLLGPDVTRWSLFREGRDADGDGRAAEDPAGDRRFDANFPADWPEHEPRAGRWPTGDPAVRALCDWILGTEELSLVVALGAVDHLRGDLRAAGRGEGRVPASGPTEGDLPWLAALVERAREATGVDTGGAEDHDSAGHFVRWAYDHRGLWTLGLRPWVLPKAAEEPEPAEDGADEAPADPEGTVLEDTAPEDATPGDAGTPDADGESPAGPPGEPSDDAGRLAWIDQQGETWRFRPWSDFDHPDLGPVQIGGFTAGAHSVPPAARWSELADGFEAFLFGLADTAPRLVLSDVRAERLAEGLYRVEARAVNRGWLPSSSEARDRSRQGRPAAVTLGLPEGADLVAGRQRVTLDALDGGGEARAEWLVRVDDPRRLTIDLTSPQAGNDQAVPTVEEAR